MLELLSVNTEKNVLIKLELNSKGAPFDANVRSLHTKATAAMNSEAVMQVMSSSIKFICYTTLFYALPKWLLPFWHHFLNG